LRRVCSATIWESLAEAICHLLVFVCPSSDRIGGGVVAHVKIARRRRCANLSRSRFRAVREERRGFTGHRARRARGRSVQEHGALGSRGEARAYAAPAVHCSGGLFPALRNPWRLFSKYRLHQRPATTHPTPYDARQHRLQFAGGLLEDPARRVERFLKVRRNTSARLPAPFRSFSASFQTPTVHRRQLLSSSASRRRRHLAIVEP